jgi:dUTP pyrophosphatase
MSEKKINMNDYKFLFDKESENTNFKDVLGSFSDRISNIQQKFDVSGFTPKKVLEYKVLNPYATHPSYVYPTDSGFDLYSTESLVIPPLGRALVPTGLSFDLPDGTELQIRSKSGLAINQGIMVLNSPGTIDCGYTGEVKIILFNCSSEPVEIERGMKIAQAVYVNCMNGKWVELEEVDEIGGKDRNENGFGSTGIK